MCENFKSLTCKYSLNYFFVTYSSQGSLALLTQEAPCVKCCPYCSLCPELDFKRPQDFPPHLRDVSQVPFTWPGLLWPIQNVTSTPLLPIPLLALLLSPALKTYNEICNSYIVIVYLLSFHSDEGSTMVEMFCCFFTNNWRLKHYLTHNRNIYKYVEWMLLTWHF